MTCRSPSSWQRNEPISARPFANTLDRSYDGVGGVLLFLPHRTLVGTGLGQKTEMGLSSPPVDP